MFEKHELWERSEDYIYVVFRDLDTDLHYAQQADFLHGGASLEDVS